MFSKKFVAAAREVSSYERPIPAPYMRRSFIVNGDVKSAVLTITGLGFYELFLNGARITRGYLAPYISNPDDVIYYDKYDIASRLRPGRNTIGIMLGNGMQDCFCAHVWDFQLAAWRGSPRTAFALELSTEAGDNVIEADANVRTADSPVYFNDLRSGERYDARRELDGWSCPDFDDSAWAHAIPVEAPRGECRIGEHEPIVIEREVAPKDVRRGRISYPAVPRADVRPQHVSVPVDEQAQEGWLYDFGENNAGVCRLKIRGERGQKIILQFGELLATDGGMDLRTMAFMPSEFNQRDVYILKGDPDGEEWTPRFTYHGFRYCLVMGMTDAQATPDALTYLIMHGDFRAMSGFHCSDDLTNKLFEATQRSNVSNFYYFPTDCPHREKNGWTGDASVSAEQFMLNQSMDNSIREWLFNVRKAQNDAGALPGIVPTGGWGFAWGNGPAWDAALTNLAYHMWKYRGDVRVINENATAIMRYIDYIWGRRDENDLIHVGLGDWCEAEQQGAPLAPLELTDTLTVMDICRKAEMMYRAVNMPERADYVKAVYDKLFKAARTNLIDEATLIAKGNCQASQAMAIYYGLFSDTERAAAVDKLVDMIHANDDLLRVGILGARVMFEVLSQNGYADLAYSVAMTERFPSFGYWMANGDTALPEDFLRVGERQDSHNHHFFGNISAWLITDITGLRVNPALNDPAELLIAPHFIAQLDNAECWHETTVGRASVAWKREGDAIRLTLAVPEGAHGTVKLSDGWHFADGASECTLAAGEYVLTR